MPFVLLVAAAAIIGGVVAVIMGRGGELTFFPRDLPPVWFGFRGPADVALLRLPVTLFGFQPYATGEALREVAALLAARDAEIAWLREQISELAARRAHEGGEQEPQDSAREDAGTTGDQKGPDHRDLSSNGLADCPAVPDTATDHLTASAGQDRLAASAGQDHLAASAGQDRLAASAGQDRLAASADPADRPSPLGSSADRPAVPDGPASDPGRDSQAGGPVAFGQARSQR